MPSVAVVIPTVAGREAALDRCVAAVAAQTRKPDEIVVVRGCPSYVSAIIAGVERTSADWIAFVDDDAVPQDEWLQTLAPHFDDATIGAVGGRILHFVEGQPTARPYSRGPVAKLTWYGRTLSHLHDAPDARVVRDVDFLPGSNMCFRRSALPAIDQRLNRGMAPGFEMALCLSVRRRGSRVVFDSAAVVSHYPEARPEQLTRSDHRRASYEYSYMIAYTLLTNLGWPRRVAFLAYFTLIGQSMSPGLVMAPYFLSRQSRRQRFFAAWAGKLRAMRESARPGR